MHRIFQSPSSRYALQLVDAVIIDATKGIGLRLKGGNNLPSTLYGGTSILRIDKETWLPYSGEYSLAAVQANSPEVISVISQVIGSENSSSTFAQAICLAIELLIARTGSKRAEYVDFLFETSWPVNSSVCPSPLLLPDKFVDLLKGTSAFSPLIIRRRSIGMLARALFPSEQQSQMFVQAMGVILSRAISSAQSMPLSLIPLIDLANHSSAPNAEVKFDRSTNAFSLFSTRQIQQGEEVFISYGPGRDNSSFVPLYGFYDDLNPNDALELTVGKAEAPESSGNNTSGRCRVSLDALRAVAVVLGGLVPQNAVVDPDTARLILRGPLSQAFSALIAEGHSALFKDGIPTVDAESRAITIILGAVDEKSRQLEVTRNLIRNEMNACSHLQLPYIPWIQSCEKMVNAELAACSTIAKLCSIL
jgi:hypothetical protein